MRASSWRPPPCSARRFLSRSRSADSAAVPDAAPSPQEDRPLGSQSCDFSSDSGREAGCGAGVSRARGIQGYPADRSGGGIEADRRRRLPGVAAIPATSIRPAATATFCFPSPRPHRRRTRAKSGTAPWGRVRLAGLAPASPQLRPAMTPPSTGTTAPVIHEAFSEARNKIASATSSGCPLRPSG